MKISVCWIAKNEEKNIARSIASVKDAVDEMIVVDTGSDDNTAEVARALGAKVATFEWINDFAAARNYAISLSTGDVVICPDADMWFEPAFGQVHRDTIEQMFADPHCDAIVIKLTDINSLTGVAINQLFSTLIFKNDGNARYVNPIHEQMLHYDGTYMWVRYALDLNVNHSGYSPEILPEKAARNLALLDLEAEREHEETGEARAITDFYLMRESLFLGQIDKSYGHFLTLHRHPHRIKEILTYNVLSASYFHLSMRLLLVQRLQASRADIRKNLNGLIRSLLPDYSGCDALDLEYMTHFDMKNDVFLAELDRIATTFDEKSDLNSSDARLSFANAVARAAHVAWQRGELARSLDYCISRFRRSDVFDENVFSVMLSCVKGQPEADVILFLNSLFNVAVPVQAHTLAEGLRKDGFQTVFLYYVKQQIDLGVATKKHFLEMLILSGHCEEAVSHALTLDRDTDAGLIADTLFFAVVCSGDRSLFERCRDDLNEVGRELAECFLDGKPVENQDLYVPTMLYACYGAIAFLGGADKAELFLGMFSSEANLCFTVESKYNVENTRFVEVLHSDYDFRDDTDPTVRDILLVAMIRSGAFEEALLLIHKSISLFIIDMPLLNHLQTLSDCADPGVAERAGALYATQSFLFDEFVDASDVVNTGLAFDALRKRDRKHYVEMTREEFESDLERDDKIVMHPAHHGTLERAAEIYEKQNIDTMALCCNMRMRACGYKTKRTTENLARLFRKLGNKTLARELAGVAETLPDVSGDRLFDSPPTYAGRAGASSAPRRRLN